MENNNEVLLKVEHLCQYFRLGRRDLKAVDDVSFEIKKGEAFGLVGESGCGKTTTGRSIIKLYNITSGNVYFKGERVGAGTRSYKDAIKNARKDAAQKIKTLRAEKPADEIKDEIRQGYIAYVINTSSLESQHDQTDGVEIRKCATENNVSIFTSLDTVRVLLDVLEETTLCISTIDA